MPYRQTNYKVLNSPDLQYICHRLGRLEWEEQPPPHPHSPLYTFNSFSLDLVAKPLFFISLLLLFYISLYFYFYSFLFFPKCLRFSPPFCCSLREPAGEVASGHKLEGCNHMLDIFMEDVRACACMQVLCVCVCREKARGDV